MAHFGGNVCTLGELHEKIKAKKVTGAFQSSDPFPVEHVADYKQVVTGMQTLVRMATRRGPVYEKATLSLPSCTWAEKSGVYENFEGRVQPFGQAIPPLEDTRSVGQIVWDLLGREGRFNAAAVRDEMTAAGMEGYVGIAEPAGTVRVDDMQFAEL
jgi:anaerobic selenocysteine-containing dehydrogenase